MPAISSRGFYPPGDSFLSRLTQEMIDEAEGAGGKLHVDEPPFEPEPTVKSQTACLHDIAGDPSGNLPVQEWLAYA